ncbi:MAG: LLM class flavin-dependent oxidoreductase [Alphaproteobacteria bacterium]|jgi:alkanesulfonate monooxygenase SsuD/methylene tetrahydromethanopterin reductase-like flavin-dependent oxidoreductase (luciferase family)|nr:LLM class flavin-dependent oxidoreductase [Alphaproteobacteria bacterium]
MKFGICVMANIDEIGFFTHAENLGYDSVWVTDSQMLFSDCYAVMALAAKQTTKLRLGPGTAITGTRIPPVQVAAMATLNRIAPGRVHLGIATGNTATRTMGQKPMRIKDYEAYLKVLSALLRGEVVDYEFEGVTRPIKMLMHEYKYMNLEPKIPLYVSGFGPRAMGLAGEYGDGLVFAIPPRGIAVAEAMAHVRQGAARANRAIDGFLNCALTNIVLLEPGEEVASERIVRMIGANVMASVYYFYDHVHERGLEPPDFLKRLWKPYCALVEDVPPEHRHFRTHEYHYTYLHPGEAELIDEQLIRDTCLVGTADELIEQIRTLEAEGLQELMFASGVDEKWHFAQEFSRQVMARL